MKIQLPRDLVEKFQHLSQVNSQEKKETGAVLAGVQKRGYYVVTHLVIPEQSGTSTFWEVNDVRQITNYFVYKPELIMLGLIHTHPGFSSFLSSIDLHALWDYARFNPDMISIVLAPEKGTSPAYSLTKKGLKELSKCKEVGHHHHEEDASYYSVADHVVDVPEL